MSSHPTQTRSKARPWSQLSSGTKEGPAAASLAAANCSPSTASVAERSVVATRTRRWFAVGLFAACLATVGLTRERWKEFLPNASNTTVMSEEVTSATSTEKVAFGVGALARLEPSWKIVQLSPSASTEGAVIESLLFDEGDVVSKGDTLAVLDIQPRREAALHEARAQARICAARLAKVKAGPSEHDVAIKQAEVDLQLIALQDAEADFRRCEALRAAKTVPEDEFENKKTQLERTKTLVEQAKSQLAALQLIRSEDLESAEAELAKAEAGVKRAEAELLAAKIVAPMNGRLLKVFSRPGERISTSGFAEIGDTSQMHAVAEVHELDVGRVKLGQTASIRVQSQETVFSGHVVRVSWKVGRQVVLDNDPVKDTDARVVEVRIALDSRACAQLAGLSYARAEVRIDATTER